jgi:hypothetical protein
MARIVRGGLIQATLAASSDLPIESIKKAMIDKHVAMIEEAGKKGVQVLCLQEIFYGPYFCAEQKTKWYGSVEKIPDGPTIRLMRDLARKLSMVIVVPIYEEEMTGVYYNTAAVIDAGGEYLGKYRKHHIPHVDPGFWEKFYFRPGNLGYPVFKTRYADIGVYICYDRHFPEGARILGLNGAEIVLTLRPRSPDCRNTSGSSSSPHTPSPTDTSSGQSIAWGGKPPGISANSTGSRTSATPGGKSSHRRAVTKMRLSWRIWTLI